MAASLDLPRLILVTGSGPGAGKSSLADALFRQLWLARKPVRWIYEADLSRVDALKRFMGEVQHEDATAFDFLLAGVRELVALWRDSVDWRYNVTLSGTPQGGVVSPILSNVYLDRLDHYVETMLLPAHNRRTERKAPRASSTTRF